MSDAPHNNHRKDGNHRRDTPWRTAAEHWLYGAGLKTVSELALPDFLGIGAQKAGTSWLHQNLQHHPDAFLPDIKEVHYFDNHFDQPLKDYAAVFDEAGARLRGEITPAYSILPVEKIRYIRQVMPSVRLIFLMRNPIERAWSHAVMTLVTQSARRFEDVSPAEFLDHFRSDANQSRGDYEAILDRWTSVFPRQQIMLGYFEDITLRPIGLLRDVCRHIGLRDDLDFEQFPYRQKVYAGPGLALPPQYAQFLRVLYSPKIDRLKKRLGARAWGWLDSMQVPH
jgi:hypothetical protein